MLALLGDEGYFVETPERDTEKGLNDAIILAAVIEAIEARGWDWTVEHCTTCGYPYTAWLAHTKPGQDSGRDSPAAALLAAYLSALEADK